MLDLRYKTILSVAVPLMASTFIQSIVLLTDAAFLSRHSILAFDAAGNAGLIYISVFMALLGLADGAQILVARRIGQKNTDAIGRIFGTSVLGLTLLAIVLFAFIQLVIPDMIHGYSKHQDLATAQVDYVTIRSFSLFFGMISLSIQAFIFATGKTWIVLISSVITAFSNIILDYLLIFGTDSIPELGLKGAALASTIADFIGMLFLILYLVFSKERKTFALFSHFSFNYKSFKELFKIGSPLMLQGFLALATWTVFFIWIEQIGKFELTVSQNIRAVYFLAFVPIFGFAATTKTYISQYMGRGDLHSLKKIQRRIQFLTVLFLFIFFHGAIFYPETLISWINPTEAYLAESGATLRFVSFSILLFGFISVYFQTINGSGNTMATLVIESLCVVIYILTAFLLIKVLKVEIFWIWSVEYVYFGSLGILSIVYLRFFEWKKKHV
jgi:MATE family multidrug resistance protein